MFIQGRGQFLRFVQPLFGRVRIFPAALASIGDQTLDGPFVKISILDDDFTQGLRYPEEHTLGEVLPEVLTADKRFAEGILALGLFD